MDAPPLHLDRLWHTPPNPTVALPLCPVVLVLAEIHNNPPLGGAIIERIRHVNPDVTRITVDHPFLAMDQPGWHVSFNNVCGHTHHQMVRARVGVDTDMATHHKTATGYDWTTSASRDSAPPACSLASSSLGLHPIEIEFDAWI